MTAARAIVVGLSRVLAAPFMVLLLYLVNLAVAVPASLIIVRSIETSVGASRFGPALEHGFDMDWFDEYKAGAVGLERTFEPAVTGAGALYSNLEAWLTGGLFDKPATLAAMGAVYAVCWAFLLGGVLDRFAGPDPRPGFGRFFKACRGYFFRFVRLAGVSAIFYFAIYRLLWIMMERIEQATRDTTAESTVAQYSLLAWGATALLLTLVHMVFGFAKVATVIEERRSVIVAAFRGVGFVLLHPAKAIGLYYGMLLISGMLVVLYAFAAPGVVQATPRAVVWALVGSQLFLLMRMMMRVGLLAAQAEIYSATVPRRSDRAATAEPVTPCRPCRSRSLHPPHAIRTTTRT